MKWVSCACQSNGTIATITPVSPPMTKVTSPPITNRVGVLKYRAADRKRRDPAEHLDARREC